MAEQGNIQLKGTQLLYRKPEPLNSEVHGKLRFRPQEANLASVDELHLVPLLVGEFAQAMFHFPIVFAGPERTPLAVMGLSPNRNLFSRNGRFDTGVYVPAYLRRYPFTLASAGEGISEDVRFVVCIDREAPGFVEDGEGEPLFEGGTPTEFTRNAINFLNQFEEGRRMTQEFVNVLEKAGLFEVKNTQFVKAGADPELIADYFGVSEEKLSQLPDDQLGDFVRRGILTAVHAHLFSLQRWNELVRRREEGATQDRASSGRKK